MAATSLSQYADRLASKLSGGNQRKLALAIAMMGECRVTLEDQVEIDMLSRKPGQPVDRRV